ncbi:hypothetical protein L2E82_45332 [Cichorium intybus]|uniref:Uncharacterized protein n=1 Tax=Cichorium intybus TaxID=13427 RepID=A0ACB8ZTJ9_CICIN|nr:hypothetical protein L2E82_45332 [Cichorium intybus]
MGRSCKVYAHRGIPGEVSCNKDGAFQVCLSAYNGTRQASEERVALLQCQLDNERRGRQEEEVVIKNLSDQMAQTKGIVTQLMSQLAAQGEKL